MKRTYPKKCTASVGPAKPFPSMSAVNVIQFQLFDNGAQPGRGRSRHVLKIEAYCDLRLDLHKPHWSRSVALLDPRTFITWVDEAAEKNAVTADQHREYKLYHDVIIERAADEDVEFAKLGHIGCKRENVYYPGEFVAVIKAKDGGLEVFLIADGAGVHTDSFIFDQRWIPGGARRKFFGFHDPHEMYAAMKREEAFALEAETRGRLREEGRARHVEYDVLGGRASPGSGVAEMPS